VIVDARGTRCPVPVIELAKALPGVAVGEVVEVLADDPAARVDIPVWCRMKGQQYDGADERDGAVAYRVRRVS
jgi:TusA-related sulfurtransferase